MGIFGDDGSHDDYLKLETRLGALEDTVARLIAEVAALRGMSAPLADPAVATSPPRWELEARVLKQAGKAIDAIKLVREETGWDLRTAKDAVDRL